MLCFPWSCSCYTLCTGGHLEPASSLTKKYNHTFWWLPRSYSGGLLILLQSVCFAPMQWIIRMILGWVIEGFQIKLARVKPSLSPDERITESLLLKERWALIGKGTDWRKTKVCRSCLYVSRLLHGQVNNGILIKSPSLGSLTPQFVSLNIHCPDNHKDSNEAECHDTQLS